MGKKPKNSLSTIITVVVLLVVLFILRQTGLISSRSGSRLGFSEDVSIGSWSADYSSLSGTYTKKLIPATDKLTISVVTNSGEVNIELVDENGNSVFSKDFTSTESEEVNATGKLTVKVKAKKHSGSFDIK